MFSQIHLSIGELNEQFDSYFKKLDVSQLIRLAVDAGTHFIQLLMSCDPKVEQRSQCIQNQSSIIGQGASSKAQSPPVDYASMEEFTHTPLTAALGGLEQTRKL